MSIKVVKCETRIKTVIGDIKAIITAICMPNNNITYEISYFQKGISTTAWIARYEFVIDYDNKAKPGLVNYDSFQNDNEFTQNILNE